MKYIFVVLIAAACCCLAGSAFAKDNKAQAKKHFDAGLTLLEADDFKGATVEFERSTDFYVTKNGLFNLANCYKALHRYGKALAAIERIETKFKGKLNKEWKSEIRAFRKQLENMVARLTLVVEPAGAMIIVDDEEVGSSPLSDPLVLGPGSYEIKGSAKGFSEKSKRITLASREIKTVTLKLEKLSSWIRVEASQDEAEVYLDDELLGTTPFQEKLEVAPGSHTIRIEKQGYESSVQTVDAAAGETSSLSFTLAETKGEVSAAAASTPAEPAPTVRNKVLMGFFWATAAGAVLTGGAAGLVYWLGSERQKDFDKALKEHERLRGEVNKDKTEQELMELQTAAGVERGHMESALNDLSLYSNLTIGLIVGAGTLGIASIVFLTVNLTVGQKSKEPKSARFLPTPTGIAVTF